MLFSYSKLKHLLTIHRLFDHLNALFYDIELRLSLRTSPQDQQHCIYHPLECTISPSWNTQIKTILEKARKTLKLTNPEDQEAVKKEAELFALVSQKDKLASLKDIWTAMQYFRKEGLDKGFDGLKQAVEDITAIIDFPIPIQHDLKRLKDEHSVVSLSHLDEKKAILLGIPHLSGFPTDDGRRRYCRTIKDLIKQNEERDFQKATGTLVPGAHDKDYLTLRSQLLMQFGADHRLLAFENQYNKIARIFQSPGQFVALQKLIDFLNRVRILPHLPQTSSKNPVIKSKAKSLLAEIDFDIIDGLFLGGTKYFRDHIEKLLDTVSTMDLSAQKKETWTHLAKSIEGIDVNYGWNHLNSDVTISSDDQALLSMWTKISRGMETNQDIFTLIHAVMPDMQLIESRFYFIGKWMYLLGLNTKFVEIKDFGRPDYLC